jgi:hypothetical protein
MGNFGLQQKFNTTKSIGDHLYLRVTLVFYYPCTEKQFILGDQNVVILSDEVGGGVRHRPLTSLQIAENSAKNIPSLAHVCRSRTLGK